MTGTQCHEGIAGAAAAVEYLCSLDAICTDPSDRADRSRSACLDRVFRRITDYERTLSESLLSGLADIPGIQLWGITDQQRLAERVPTVSLTLDGRTPREAAEWLADRGLYVWNGNHYALPFTEAAGLEPGGTIRVGALHYNSKDEIERLVSALHEYQASEPV